MYNPNEKGMIDERLNERIDAAISSGIKQGLIKIQYRRKQIRRRFGGTIAACILLVSCLFIIRVSPVFAAIVRDIPGFEKFVDLINNSNDKGIKLAMDNDLIQPIGVSDEHEGVKFIVQGIIADESRMVVFYEIQMPKNNDSLQLAQPYLSDLSGGKLPASISFSSFDYPEEAKQGIREVGIQYGTADFQLKQGTPLPDEVVIKLKLIKQTHNLSDAPRDLIAGEEETPTGKAEAGGVEFKVKIPIDRARFAGLRHEYEIGQTIQIENQSISFSKAVVSPLRIALHMDYGKDNSKQIFDAGDIRVVDDKGTVWRNTSGSMENGTPIYYFESPYLQEPKSLTIEGSWFRALDKSRMSVLVDTEKGKLVQAPDEKLDIYKVTKNEKNTKLDFALNGLDRSDKMMYSLFEGEFTDATGKRFKMEDIQQVASSYVEGTESGEQHVMYYIENHLYEQPLNFTLYQYPEYIRQSYKIRINNT